MSTITCIRTKHNPNQTYEEFKAARLQGFGASDMGSLLNEGDYSCKRRLFLERLGLFPEEGDRLMHHIERGKFLEAPVAGLYAAKTGRSVKEVGTAYIKEFPFMRANADRMTTDDVLPTKMAGVLEIKCPGEHMFRKIKKDGLPLSYILQLQWQMFCYGTGWGSFAIYWSDGHELITFDVERDDALIEGLITRVKEEWQTLHVLQNSTINGADQAFIMAGFPCALDPHSKACARCPMFETCHAVAYEAGKSIQDDALAPDAKDYLEVTAQIKELEKRKDEIKETFAECFKDAGCNTIASGPFMIQRSERSREVLSSKVKQVLTPDQLASYVSNSSYEVITVKGPK